MEVRARAPGKIILAGEHAVVHGSAAVATSVDLYTYVSLRFPTPADNDETLSLQLKDASLEFSWPVARIKEAFPNLEPQIPPSSCSPETLKLIASLVDEQNIPEANIGFASGVTAFLWLFTSIHGCKPAKVVINSELPLGSGLGSSAAFCVALSAAILALSDSVTMDFSHQGWQVFGENELELVNKWAFEGEKIIHGKPSGIDNTVSTYEEERKRRREAAAFCCRRKKKKKKRSSSTAAAAAAVASTAASAVSAAAAAAAAAVEAATGRKWRRKKFGSLGLYIGFGPGFCRSGPWTESFRSGSWSLKTGDSVFGPNLFDSIRFDFNLLCTLPVMSYIH